MWIKDVCGYVILPYHFLRLIKNPSIAVDDRDAINSITLNRHINIAGSCNGLICVYYKTTMVSVTNWKYEYSFLIENLSTRNKSPILVPLRYIFPTDRLDYFKLIVGYDDSTKTYKIVAIRFEGNKESGMTNSEVKIFSLGGSCWKNIPSFPLSPLNWMDSLINLINNGLHLSGTINWLAIHNYPYSIYEQKSITFVDQFVMISLDLSTETFKLLLLPRGFDEVPFIQPALKVLMESLCFSHDSKKTEFVLWQMKENGIQESWTRLFKISYESLEMHKIDDDFQLLCLYKNGDNVIFGNKFGKSVMMYSLKDKIIEKISFPAYNNIKFGVGTLDWCYYPNDYVESLVPVL